MLCGFFLCSTHYTSDWLGGDCGCCSLFHLYRNDKLTKISLKVMLKFWSTAAVEKSDPAKKLNLASLYDITISSGYPSGYLDILIQNLTESPYPLTLIDLWCSKSLCCWLCYGDCMHCWTVVVWWLYRIKDVLLYNDCLTFDTFWCSLLSSWHCGLYWRPMVDATERHQQVMWARLNPVQY